MIIFSAPADKPNDVSLGHLFVRLPLLQEISITHSSLPAIGDSSFWPGNNVLLLDLSYNRIRILREVDFRGLISLQTLNLSHNNLTDAPSAVFRLLSNLTKLDLSCNKFAKLVPRLFYKLDKLTYLDLSQNPLTSQPEISVETFKDLSSLQVLKIEKTSIRSVSLDTYKELPNLKELHLSDNKIQTLHSFEFHSLSNYLKYLYLDGNEIEVMRDNAFFGLRLLNLGLSRNRLTTLPSCAFCGLQVQSLDLSSNRFTIFDGSLLAPLSASLVILNVGTNHRLEDPNLSIFNLVSPLKSAQTIKLSFNSLNDSLPDNTFSHMTQLQSLDLSHNQFANLSARYFKGLNNLESLDLSNNRIASLDSELLFSLDSILPLKSVYLQSNPWSCKRCDIRPLMDWISNRSPPSYFNVCFKNNNHDTSFNSLSSSASSSNACVICSSPSHLLGKALHSITEADLEDCLESDKMQDEKPLSTSTEPRLALIHYMVISITILVLLTALLCVIFKKARKGASYYTHEGGCQFKATTASCHALNNHHHHGHHHHHFYQTRHQNHHTIASHHHRQRSLSSSSSFYSQGSQSLHRNHRHHYLEDDTPVYFTPHSRRHHHHRRHLDPFKLNKTCCSHDQSFVSKKRRKACQTPSSTSSSNSSYKRMMSLPRELMDKMLRMGTCSVRRASSSTSSSPTFTCSGLNSHPSHSRLPGGRSPSFGQRFGIPFNSCTGNNNSFSHDNSSADSPPTMMPSSVNSCFTRKFMVMNNLKSPFKCSTRKESTDYCNSSSPLSEIDLNSSSSSPEASPGFNGHVDGGAKPKTRF